MKTRWTVLFCIIFVLLLSACGVSSSSSTNEESNAEVQQGEVQDLDQEVETSTDTAMPTNTNTPEPEFTATTEPLPTVSYPIVFEDDFEDVNSGWERYNAFDGVLDYFEGSYRMFVGVEDNLFWVFGGKNYSDSIIEVTAVKHNGPDNNAYGVMCRYNETDTSFYLFLVSSMGNFGVANFHDWQAEFFGEGYMTPHPAVNIGLEPNLLRAECIGQTLRFFVNGELLIEVEDDSYTEGDFGMLVGTYAVGGSDVLFDDLKVYQP